MHQRRRIRPGHDDLEQREEAVHGVLGDVAPRPEHVREPGAAVEARPVDDGDDERVDDDGRVEEGVEGLEGPREALEEGPAGDGVGEGVDGGGEEVEGDAPVG